MSLAIHIRTRLYIIPNKTWKVWKTRNKAEDPSWIEAQRQSAYLANEAQTEVSLYLTIVDYQASVENEINENAEIVFIATEQDLLWYDRIELYRLPLWNRP